MRVNDRVFHETLGYGTVVMSREHFEFNILIRVDLTLREYWVRARDLEVVKVRKLVK